MVDLLDDDGLLDLREGSSDPQKAVAEIRAGHQKAPATNKELEAWAQERPKVSHDGCHLCGNTPRLQCGVCQKPACGKDSWVMLGICRDCATEDRMRMWHERNRKVSDNWL